MIKNEKYSFPVLCCLNRKNAGSFFKVKKKYWKIYLNRKWHKRNIITMETDKGVELKGTQRMILYTFSNFISRVSYQVTRNWHEVLRLLHNLSFRADDPGSLCLFINFVVFSNKSHKLFRFSFFFSFCFPKSSCLHVKWICRFRVLVVLIKQKTKTKTVFIFK